MSRETYIWIAFCVFAFLIGMRLKRYFGRNKREEQPEAVRKNQRPKMARQHVSPPQPRRRKQEKTIRVFTVIMMVMVFLIIIGMIPTLMRDLPRSGGVDPANLFLRVLIFCFALLVFVSAYIKLARTRKKRPGKDTPEIKK